jgi:mRNA-degrading endonuclease RelE of RelBE toxin-antitoxin system
MKTTIEIPDSILKEARKLASREGTTVKALVVESLQKVIAERKRPTVFKLRKASFKGKGLQSHLKDATWERIRDLVYEGRGA